MASIVTGWGDQLGTGHIQRMASLAEFLNLKKSVRASLISIERPEFLPPSVYRYIDSEISPDTTCIIRDMRDSTIDDMLKLKQNHPVIAVDDCGPGRDRADLAIDLLPNLAHVIYKKEQFLYGYNFIDSIRRLGGSSLAKTIDCAVYCGFNPHRDTVKFFLSLIPPHATCAILSGDNSLLFRNGVSSPLSKSCAEILLSSNVLIAHFGITLYEGYISGCRLVSINPTEYHARLADVAAKDIGILNLGTAGALEPDQARSSISRMMQNPVHTKIDPAAIMEQIENGLEEFTSRITPFLDN